jgi:IclR family KDG regulon transcriptional repressor
LTDYTVAVLEDAIAILELLQNQDDGLTLAQITDASGHVKNKVFRILYTLEKHRLVARDDNGFYRLGMRFLEFGQQVKKQTTLLEASRSTLDWLVHKTGESIFLGIVSGSDALCVAARESPQSVRLFAEVGRRAPLHSGGVPKVLLAHLPDVEQRDALDQFTDLEAIEIDTLKHQLAQVKNQGYAVVVDELDIGAHSIAAPIRDYRGCVVAGLSIAGPSHRFSEEIIEHYIELVQQAAAQISHTLGYQPAEPHLNGSGKLYRL